MSRHIRFIVYEIIWANHFHCLDFKLQLVTVTWSPTETIEIRLILFPVFELTVASHQRMTVKA